MSGSLASYNDNTASISKNIKLFWLADALKKFVFYRVVNSPLGNVEVVGADENDEAWDKIQKDKDKVNKESNTDNITDVFALPHIQLSHSQVVIRRLTMGA